MKTLYLVRHAKSDWSNLYLNDFDRTLNERGLRDASMMGMRLLDKHCNINLLISSTAKRANQTAQLIAKEINYDLAKIDWKEELYHAPISTIETTIFGINNKIENAMIVCHNPGITYFVNSIAEGMLSDMPTCGICAFEFEVEKWESFRLAKTSLLFYDFPKNGMG